MSRKERHSCSARRSKYLIICALTDWLRNKPLITGKRTFTRAGSHKGTSQCGWKMRCISEERLQMVVWRLQHVASERSSFLSLKEPWNFGLRAVRLSCGQSLDHSLLQRWRNWGRHWTFWSMPSSSVMAGLMSSRGVMLCNIINIMGKLAQSTLPVSKRSTSGCGTSFKGGIWTMCSMWMKQVSSGRPYKTMVCQWKGCLGGN